MGRLKGLPPRLKALPSRFGSTVGDKQGQDKARNELHDWRGWYATKTWRDLRMQVFVRDSFTCRRTGVLCIGRHPADNSPVANHKRPHRGDPALFWDVDNIETVTKAVHDGLIQREEQAMPHGIWD
jgi:hypothetical protein